MDGLTEHERENVQTFLDDLAPIIVKFVTASHSSKKQTNKKKKKREREDEEKEEEEEGEENKKEDEDFVCEGHVWKSPAEPCQAKPEDRVIREKMQLSVPQENGKNKLVKYTVCKGCKKARTNELSKKRKAAQKKE